MDMNPIYGLRSRLRAAAIAGTGLLSEDFRLKRAVEAMKPLAASSPVFAKISQMADALVSPDCADPAGALLDAIALTDAVICTLGTVDVQSAVTPIETGQQTGNIIVNAPHSVLKELLDALTTPGGGHYSYVWDTHRERPELFQDYRVKPALVQALGASYADLADLAGYWLKEEDETTLPLLYKGFDPKGKKEMVRRVQVIGHIAGERANDFYIRMLETAEKEVRQELIQALRYDQGNVGLLLDMVKTEKGKNKQAVMYALAAMEDEEAFAFFRKMLAKKPADAVMHMVMAPAAWASEIVAQGLEMAIQELLKVTTADIDAMTSRGKSGSNAANRIQIFNRTLMKDAVNDAVLGHIRLFNHCAAALLGRGGERICSCYRLMLGHKDQLDILRRIGLMGFNTFDYPFGQHIPASLYKISQDSFERGIMGIMFLSMTIRQDECLSALAMELYGENRDYRYLPAAVVVKLGEGGDVVQWLDAQIAYKKHYLETIQTALSYVQWDKKTKGYVTWVCDPGYGYGYYTPQWEMYREQMTPKQILPIDRETAWSIILWMKEHASKKMDQIVFQWLPKDDDELCRSMGEWFYKRALVTADNGQYLMYMKECGWTQCKGLGVNFVKNRTRDIYLSQIRDHLLSLPCSKQEIAEEARAICDAIRSGQIQVDKKKIDVEMLEDWSQRL